jgi:hypothetical protein
MVWPRTRPAIWRSSARLHCASRQVTPRQHREPRCSRWCTLSVVRTLVQADRRSFNQNASGGGAVCWLQADANASPRCGDSLRAAHRTVFAISCPATPIAAALRGRRCAPSSAVARFGRAVIVTTMAKLRAHQAMQDPVSARHARTTSWCRRQPTCRLASGDMACRPFYLARSTVTRICSPPHSAASRARTAQRGPKCPAGAVCAARWSRADCMARVI